MENTNSAEPTPTTPAASNVNPEEILTEMLRHLGVEGTVERFTVEGQTMLHITTTEAGRLIGKQGWTLNDLQYILNIILWRKDPNAGRVVVDVERYRERQRDEILKKVYDAMDRVRRWGEPVTLEPLNSFDRRLVHQTVAKDPEMETNSDESGEGDRKTITIRLKQS